MLLVPEAISSTTEKIKLMNALGSLKVSAFAALILLFLSNCSALDFPTVLQSLTNNSVYQSAMRSLLLSNAFFKLRLSVSHHGA